MGTGHTHASPPQGPAHREAYPEFTETLVAEPGRRGEASDLPRRRVGVGGLVMGRRGSGTKGSPCRARAASGPPELSAPLENQPRLLHWVFRDVAKSV